MRTRSGECAVSITISRSCPVASLLLKLLLLVVLAASAARALAQGQAQAPTYPNKPIRIVIPFAPAGPSDMIGRLTGQKLSELLGQPVIIENRGGAGGNLGAAVAAKSLPDGYTLLITTSAFAVNVTLAPKGGFDAERDFVPVALIARQANLIFVNPSVAAKTLPELLALAKASKLSFASPGSGTTPHLAAEALFNITAKLDMTAVHYRGAAPAISAVVGGELPVGAGALSTPLPFVKSGRLRPIAVSSANRSAALPDVPTIAESGFPGVDDDTWVGLFAPAGTPSTIVQQLNEAINQMLNQGDTRERLDTMAFEPVGGTVQQFGTTLKSEIAKWGKVVRDGNVKPD